jgi:hypothetical protein
MVGVVSALSYLVVHRALRRAGLFPGRSLNDFLDWCVAHRLLLPVGYGYRFLHPTFQEHLAREWRRERSNVARSDGHESGVTPRR